MFEDFSRIRRLVAWLETVTQDARAAYPEPDSLADDAKSFLARFDRMRADQRDLDKRYRDLVADLRALSDESVPARPEQLLDALQAKISDEREAGARQIAEKESELDGLKQGLESTRSELESAKADLADVRAELQREQRKLDPVLRYAYNLRRLVQKIYTKGELTPSINSYIEELLEAGGASVNGRVPHAAQARSANATSTIT